MAVYQITLTTLSPLHIGDGNELRFGFDYMVEQGNTYRLNLDALLEARGEDLRPDRMGKYPQPGSLLRPADFQNAELFRYVIPGAPRSGKVYASLRSCIKDVYDCPYIPGSSLKGAFRTALAWTGWKELNIRLDRPALGYKSEKAAQPLEKKIFGPDPNHDLLRALQVSDLTGSRTPGAKLRIINAQVLTQKAAGSPVELEAVGGDAVFKGSLQIDETLFSQTAEKELRFANRRHWLDELLPRVQKHSLARLQTLSTWFEQAQNTANAARFLRQLQNLSLKPNQALLQLGWGTGWDGTTFGTHLQQNPVFFEQLVTYFGMHKANRNAPRRRPGDPFPRSKRVIMKLVNGQPAAVAPLGWVLVEMEKVR